MERAAFRPKEEDRHPEPVPRDADLPTLSDATLMLFAGTALIATAAALLVLFG